MMYLVAIYKDNEGVCSTLNYRNTKEKDAELKVDEMYLKQLGYKLVSCVFTSDRTIYLKTKLKARLTELRSLKSDIDYYGYDECLMKQIGLLVNRLQRLEVEITDELALQCKDFRDQRILERQVQSIQIEPQFEEF